jgi:hypothetical protein
MPYCNLVKPYRQPLQLQHIVGTCQICMYRKTAEIMNADQVDALLESVIFRGFKYHRRMQGRTPSPSRSMFCCKQRASYFDFFHADVIPALSLFSALGSGVLFLLSPMPYCNLVKPYRQPLQLQRIVGTCQIRMYRKTVKIMNADQVDALLESVIFRGFKYHRGSSPSGSMFCCEQRASYFDFFHADVIPALSSRL